jgi:adhesin/invasin
VTAFDAYGNVVTGYTGTVHFTTSDAKASVPVDYTFTAADNGSHTFPYTLRTPLVLRTTGSRWVRATDVTVPTTTGVQSGILVQ